MGNSNKTFTIENKSSEEVQCVTDFQLPAIAIVVPDVKVMIHSRYYTESPKFIDCKGNKIECHPKRNHIGNLLIIRSTPDEYIVTDNVCQINIIKNYDDPIYNSLTAYSNVQENTIVSIANRSTRSIYFRTIEYELAEKWAHTPIIPNGYSILPPGYKTAHRDYFSCMIQIDNLNFDLSKSDKFNGLFVRFRHKIVNKRKYLKATFYDDPKFRLILSNLTDFGITLFREDGDPVIVGPKSFMECVNIREIKTIKGTSLNYSNVTPGIIFVDEFKFNITQSKVDETKIIVEPRHGG